MRNLTNSKLRSVLVALLAWGTAAPGRGAESRALAEWTFARAGDTEEWRANAHLVDVRVEDGALHCRGQGPDPILELVPRLDLVASPWQALEVRLHADRDGVAEFFWSNTDQGRYGGFSQDKSTRFNVRGDGQWRTYRLWPFWQVEQRIVRLRFDLYDAARFAIDAIRVIAPADPPVTGPAKADFDFREANWAGWQSVDGVVAQPAAQGLVCREWPPSSFLLSPPVGIDAAEQSHVALSMSVEPLRPQADTDEGGRAESDSIAAAGGAAGAGRTSLGTLLFATEESRGLHSLSFLVEADGRAHIYNLDLLASAAWRGRVIALGLRLGGAPASQAVLHWLRVGDAPVGPAHLRVVAFGLEDALARVGRPVKLGALVANTGGAPATDLRARITVPPGVQVVGGGPEAEPVATLAPGAEVGFKWTLVAAAPVTGSAAVTVEFKPAAGVASEEPAADRRRAERGAQLRFTQPPRVNGTDYVPEPEPVRGPYEVGVYYFPGWRSASQWHPIQRFSERKPVLGWYREGDPEVADWHIKWAVEHGITFFAYDWYWSQGARQLEHALHEGYFRARYRHLLKFCLLWANHNAPGTSTLDDCRAVTRYWIANYLRRPEYFTLEGKPLAIVFSPDRLAADLGAAGVKVALEKMREECRVAGLAGLLLAACVGDAGQAGQAAAEGYDIVTAYTWPHLGVPDGELFAPYETLLPGYVRYWEHLAERGPLPLLAPLNGGWDSRPWHGENHLVRYGRTPGLLRRHLEDARRFVAARPAARALPALLVEAWNEFGEGSYIEPHQEFGFGYLDALRAVFTDAPAEHVDLTPADVGLGPYDVPALVPGQTAWEFERDDEGWSNVMDLTGVRIAEGVWQGRTTGHDPALFGPPLQARAADFAAVVVRLKLSSADGRPFQDRAQLFWRTSRLPESEATSERFAVVGDGTWREYRVPVRENGRWRGSITRLRLDPCNRLGVAVELDFVRLDPVER